MKTVRKTRVAQAVCFLVLTTVFCAMTLGDGSGRSGPPMPGAPSHGDLTMPPIPNETEVVRAVFATFPDVDPAQVISFIEEQFPLEMYAFKNALLRKREDAVQIFTSLVRESLAVMAVESRDPQRFNKILEQKKSERKAVESAEASRRSKGAPREEALAELRDSLSKAFEIKQELMKTEIADLASELQKLEKLIARREKNREAIIARRVGQMTGELDALMW